MDRQEIITYIEAHGGSEGLDLSGRDLAGVDLSGLDLHGANLARADLRHADLRWTDLSDADLSWALLHKADLRWADLHGANLQHARLQRANLGWANLTRAMLIGADLADVDLSLVELSETAGVPAGAWDGRYAAGPRIHVSAYEWLSPVRLFSMVLVLLGLTYLWGWLYRAHYLGAFGLSWAATLEPLADLLRGWQVITLSLKLLAMLPLVVLYSLMALGALLLIPLAFIVLWDRLSSRFPPARSIIAGVLLLAYLISFLILFPELVPLWGWLIHKGVPAREGFQLFSDFLKTGSSVEKVLFTFALLLTIIPLWAVYRLLSNWIRNREIPNEWQVRYPRLVETFTAFRQSRLFSRHQLLTVPERNAALAAGAILLLAVPTFVAQVGRLDAQSDMCDGGSLPQVQLYSKEFRLPPKIETPYCTYLLLERNNKFYVFRPFETAEDNGQRKPVVYEIDSAEASLRTLRDSRRCLTCAEVGDLTVSQPVVFIPGTELAPAIAVDTAASPTFTVIGQGWPAFAQVTISLVPQGVAGPEARGVAAAPFRAGDQQQAAGEPVRLGTVTASADGTFTADFVWTPGMPLGDGIVVLVEVEGTQYRAAVPFVLQPPQPSLTPTFIVVTSSPTLAVPTMTPFPTNTFGPTDTPGPTSTPAPTDTPAPTNTPLPTATPEGRDQYEPDNFAEQASHIALGETQSHTFFPAGDIDKIRFRVKRGRSYRVRTSNLALGVDTKIILAVDAIMCRPETCESDDAQPGISLASEVEFVSAIDGIAFATIINLDQYGPDKTYQVTVEEFSPTLTPTLTPTPTPSSTPTPSRTPTPSQTPTPSRTPTPSLTWTPTVEPPATHTPTPKPTPAELIAPGHLTCEVVGPHRIDLRWADYTVGETDFRIEHSRDGQNWTEIATVEANVVSFSVTGLEPQTQYWFRVRAHRADDNVFSDYTDPASCRTPPEEPAPAAPSNLVCQVVAPSQIDLTWINHTTALTNNRIERRTSEGDWSEIAVVPGDATAHSDTSVTPDVQYFYRIRAFREEDGKYSAYSNETDCTMTTTP